MAGVQATKEPVLAGICQLLACLRRHCIRLNKVVSHIDTELHRRVLLDGSVRVYGKPRADVAMSSLRRMVLSDLVVQLKFSGEAMRSLWLTEI